MDSQIVRKLNSTSGESIAETLVAVLIAAIALLMLAGTINTASNLITKSKNTLDEYYHSNNKVEARASASDPDNDYSVGSARVTFDDSSLNWGGYENSVSTYINSRFSSKPVISYSYNEPTEPTKP